MAVFRSLRVRLPLLFLAGIALAGIVTTLIAVRLFQNFAHDQALAGLNREANGIAALYTAAINASYGNKNDRQAPAEFAAAKLEQATGDKIYYIGSTPFPGQITGLKRLPVKTIDWKSGKSLTFEFTPPGAHRKYLAVANPINLGGARPDVGGRDRRGDAEGRHQRARHGPDQAARDPGTARAPRRRSDRVVPLAPHRAARAAALRRGRRGRRRPLCGDRPGARTGRASAI